jgi:hypothetical protein
MKATGANGQRGRDRPPPKLEEFGSRTRNGFVTRRESFSQPYLNNSHFSQWDLRKNIKKSD